MMQKYRIKINIETINEDQYEKIIIKELFNEKDVKNFILKIKRKIIEEKGYLWINPEDPEGIRDITFIPIRSIAFIHFAVS
jgi:hypothetical protein